MYMKQHVDPTPLTITKTRPQQIRLGYIKDIKN